jgi:hypothetical protein
LAFSSKLSSARLIRWYCRPNDHSAVAQLAWGPHPEFCPGGPQSLRDRSNTDSTGKRSGWQDDSLRSALRNSLSGGKLQLRLSIAARPDLAQAWKTGAFPGPLRRTSESIPICLISEDLRNGCSKMPSCADGILSCPNAGFELLSWALASQDCEPFGVTLLGHPRVFVEWLHAGNALVGVHLNLGALDFGWLVCEHNHRYHWHPLYSNWHANPAISCFQSLTGGAWIRKFQKQDILSRFGS